MSLSRGLDVSTPLVQWASGSHTFVTLLHCAYLQRNLTKEAQNVNQMGDALGRGDRGSRSPHQCLNPTKEGALVLMQVSSVDLC